MASTKKPLVSVIIPVFNEKKTIVKILEKVNKVNISKEVIVVCDGSTDGTREIVKNKRNHSVLTRVKVIFHKKNYGKGKAIRTGLKHAQGEILIIQDGDLEQDPQDYHELVKPIQQGNSQVVFGSRFKQGKVKIGFLSKAANLVVTFLANSLFSANITDAACGYKVMPTSIYKRLKLESDGFEVCPETIVKVKKLGFQITEVPVKFFPRSKEEGKKIRWTDGFKAIFTYFKYKMVTSCL